MSNENTSSQAPSDLAPSQRPRFRRGDVVHVRAGARHPIYPDLPMGGWSGTVDGTQRNKKTGQRRYWIEFFQSTTDRLHPVYEDRERRDNAFGCDFWDNWLPDELLEAGEVLPEAIEQPALPAWAEKAGDRQIRSLFNLSEDDVYPECGPTTWQIWRDFLLEHIPLPRPAKWMGEHDLDGAELMLLRILVPEDVEPDDFDDELHGLYAEVRAGDETEVQRLDEIELADDDPFDNLLRDYECWYDRVHSRYSRGEYDDEDEGVSSAEFRRMWQSAMRGAWKGVFDRAPDESDLERARDMAKQLEEPDVRTFFDATAIAGDAIDEPDDDEIGSRPEPIRAAPRVGRNDPCPCGSGKKYKKCCLRGG